MANEIELNVFEPRISRMSADKTVSRARFAQGAEAQREEIQNWFYWFCLISAPPRLRASNLLSAFIPGAPGFKCIFGVN
jgi:hypothetical protein